MLVAEFQNAEYGIKAIINQIGAERFSVVLMDTDAGEVLDTVQIYPALESAMAYAMSLVV